MRRIARALKLKWGIHSNVDFVLIMVVFSLAGMAVAFMRKPIFHAIGVTAQTPLWIKILIYIPLIFPLYQINLMIFGMLLGQFQFFWDKEKKLGKLLIQLISGRGGVDSRR